jgi:hypothetical protein
MGGIVALAGLLLTMAGLHGFGRSGVDRPRVKRKRKKHRQRKPVDNA